MLCLLRVSVTDLETGGSGTQLPSLQTGRSDHACEHFINKMGQTVRSHHFITHE